MLCPVEGTELQHAKLRGLEVDRCPECDGEYLDHDQLAELEDQVFDHDIPKGTIHFGDHEVEHECPHCGKQMLRFRYRGWPLEIERCPDEEGYWLDKGEEKHIRDYMKERKSRLSRASSAEASFDKWRHGGSGGFFQKIKNIFR